MPAGSLRAWVELIAGYSPVTAPVVLEVGAGTGMFCAGLARWGGAPLVAGVDPSAPMLAEARRVNAGTGGVHYARGSADALPVRSGRFDLVLMSRVTHHLPDRRSAARETRRVLRPGGTAVVRTTFRQRLDAVVHDYWPRLREVDGRRFPAEARVPADFTESGFEVVEVTSFAQSVTGSLREYGERMGSRPLAKFAHLAREEFAEGLARLAADAAAESERQPEPVEERYDVAVLRRR